MLFLGALLSSGLVFLGGAPAAHALSPEITYHRIVFPVQGAVSYGDTWGACRSGCARQHEGTDIMGSKLQPLLAAVDGRIGWTRLDGNNMLSLRGADGWSYSYIHINNDSPGTDDGANPVQWILAPGVVPGMQVKAGQHIAFMGDSGNAEGTSPHLHFEIHKPGGEPVNPYWSLMLSQGRRVHDRCGFDDNPAGSPSIAAAPGYWSTASDGSVFTFGGAPFHGGMGGKRLAAPVIGMTPTPSKGGYWQLSSDGGIFSFGDARFFGSTGAMRLNQPVVGMASTPTGRGYWLVARDGGVFTFGDAKFLGSMGAVRLNQPIVGMAVHPTGGGYYLVARDGGIFTFGTAKFRGSTGNIRLNQPIVGMAVHPRGLGYWFVAADGGVFAFPSPRLFYGSQGGTTLPAPVVGMASSATGNGYWLLGRDGALYDFGDAGF